ncbi:MAG: N-acetylmannosamine-6-phosphate 2-epimerase [Deinococcales bacterium]
MVNKLKRGLIVSCQAREDNPLHGPPFMAAMAKAAEQGGAVGLRANGAPDIKAIRALSQLPVIGLNKRDVAGYEAYITPDWCDVEEVARAQAHIIAIDATKQSRPAGPAYPFIQELKQRGYTILADISSLDEGLEAARAGADYIATTLSGYTPYSPQQKGPDLDLVSALVETLDTPIIAEGRYAQLEQIQAAFNRGAYAVVVGTAITNPREITRSLVKRLQL